ncbi:unnamed protein product [Fasciola hepatica]|uniref:Uncharacterized protein n=1 Tax=Fasciola hepatica TaxID=6192 RepID=A0ABC9HHC8_FASHE
MIVTGVSIERNISLWFTTYNYRQRDSASEVDYNTEIITVNTKSLTMTVEDRSKQQNVTRESCSRGLTNKRNQMIPISIIGFLIAYH